MLDRQEEVRINNIGRKNVQRTEGKEKEYGSLEQGTKRQGRNEGRKIRRLQVGKGEHIVIRKGGQKEEKKESREEGRFLRRKIKRKKRQPAGKNGEWQKRKETKKYIKIYKNYKII